MISARTARYAAEAVARHHAGNSARGVRGLGDGTTDGSPCALPDGSAGGVYYQGNCVAPGDTGSPCTLNGAQGHYDEMFCSVPDDTACTANDGTPGTFMQGSCVSSTTGVGGVSDPTQITVNAPGSVAPTSSSVPNWVTFLQTILAIRSGQAQAPVAVPVASSAFGLPATGSPSAAKESF